MTPDSARKTLAAYIGALITRSGGSHVLLWPGVPPMLRVYGDAQPLPGALLTTAYIAALAHGCMPEKRARQFGEEGRTRFVMRAVELKRRFLIDVRQGRTGVELEISEADRQPPAFEHVPFDPARTPPALSVEVEPD